MAPVRDPLPAERPPGETPEPPAGSGVARPRTIRVIHLEDDIQVARVVSEILERRPGSEFEIEHHTTLNAALAAIPPVRPGDVLLLDLNLPDSAGWDTFTAVHRRLPELPMVILTGYPDEELAMRAVHEGGQDYLLKTEIAEPGLLARVLHYAVERHDYLMQIESSKQLLQRQKRELEQALKSLEKTSAALVESEKIKSLGQMAAGIAHELKNPLAILRMGLDYLNRAKPEKREAAVANIMPDLLAALSRADDIIADMMDYSAPRSLHTEMGSLNRLIEEAADIMKPLFTKNHIEAVLELAPALPELALDRQKIIQLMLNVMGNAAQAMPSGGTLKITTRAAHMKFDNGETVPEVDLPEPLLVVAEVHDSGPGIPDDVLPRVFDPFFTTKGEMGGNGLGLAVCNMIMDLHGGKLELNNHPDGGAVARLTFIA